MSDFEWQRSSELSTLVREHDKERRAKEAAMWRSARAKDAKMARKIWAARRNAMAKAINDFWDAPTCSNELGLGRLLISV